MEHEVYYRFYKSLPLVSVLSQIHPVQALPSYFCMVYLNIIFPPTPMFTKWAAHVTIIHLVSLTIVWDKYKRGECCKYVPRLLVLGFVFMLRLVYHRVCGQFQGPEPKNLDAPEPQAPVIRHSSGASKRVSPRRTAVWMF